MCSSDLASINYIGSHTDKRGTITVDSLQKGEYALGFYDFAAGLTESPLQWKHKVSVYPNPSQNIFTIDVDGLTGGAECKVMDLGGREVFSRQLTAGVQQLQWDSNRLPSGTYRILILEKGKCTGVGSAVKN